MSQADTKERILNVAEELFARQGFHATSLRGITGAAGVNLAAVNYHFGSKESLLDAVFERRLVPLNAERRARLEAVQAAAAVAERSLCAEEVLRAFIEPTLHFRESSAGAEAFVTLVGRSLAEPDETVRERFVRHMRPIFILLFECLVAARPDLPRDLLFWRLHLTLGAIGHAMCWLGHLRKGNGGPLPEGVLPPEDGKTLAAMVLGFVTAGMEAPCP